MFLAGMNGMTTDKVVILETIGERQDAMSHNSDAIVFVPGGIGTLYEFWASVEALRSGEINAKLFLYNFEGFYNKQIEFYDFINQNGFTKTGQGGSAYKIKPEDLFTVVETPEALIKELLKIKK
jgi:predicted Rossmann-fold nucleotide-binding protein